MFLQFSAMSGDDVDLIYAQVYTQVPVQIQIREFEFQPQTRAEGESASVYLVLTNYTILLVGERTDSNGVCPNSFDSVFFVRFSCCFCGKCRGQAVRAKAGAEAGYVSCSGVRCGAHSCIGISEINDIYKYTFHEWYNKRKVNRIKSSIKCVCICIKGIQIWSHFT